MVWPWCYYDCRAPGVELITCSLGRWLIRKECVREGFVGLGIAQGKEAKFHVIHFLFS